MVGHHPRVLRQCVALFVQQEIVVILYFGILHDKGIMLFQALQYGDGKCERDVDRGTKNW